MHIGRPSPSPERHSPRERSAIGEVYFVPMSQHKRPRRTWNVVQEFSRHPGWHLHGGSNAVSESSPLRILLVDDTPGAETYVARWLRADIPTVDVRRAPSQA